MKAILIFNLPEEASEHRLAVNAGTYFSALHDLREALLRLREDAGSETVEVVWRLFLEHTESVNWDEIR